jgi:hypothetical protein
MQKGRPVKAALVDDYSESLVAALRDESRGVADGGGACCDWASSANANIGCCGHIAPVVLGGIAFYFYTWAAA